MERGRAVTCSRTARSCEAPEGRAPRAFVVGGSVWRGLFIQDLCFFKLLCHKHLSSIHI
jgi:hypothetical protein